MTTIEIAWRPAALSLILYDNGVAKRSRDNVDLGSATEELV